MENFDICFTKIAIKIAEFSYWWGYDSYTTPMFVLSSHGWGYIGLFLQEIGVGILWNQQFLYLYNIW